MREYLDKAIKADQWAQYVDDIGIAANDTKSYVPRSGLFLSECIRTAGLKLTMSKCNFGVKQADFLGRTLTPEGVASQADKVKSFLSNLRYSKSKKALQRYRGFLNYYRNCLPKLFEELSPFFKVFKETSKFYVPKNLVEGFTNLNRLLENSCQLAWRQPLKDKQLTVAYITTPNMELCVFQESRKIGFCDRQNVFSRNEEKVKFKVPTI